MDREPERVAAQVAPVDERGLTMSHRARQAATRRRYGDAARAPRASRSAPC